MTGQDRPTNLLDFLIAHIRPVRHIFVNDHVLFAACTIYKPTSRLGLLKLLDLSIISNAWNRFQLMLWPFCFCKLTCVFNLGCDNGIPVLTIPATMQPVLTVVEHILGVLWSEHVVVLLLVNGWLVLLQASWVRELLLLLFRDLMLIVVFDCFLAHLQTDISRQFYICKLQLYFISKSVWVW